MDNKKLIALADELSFAAENTQGCLYSQRKMLHAAARYIRTASTPPAQPAPAGFKCEDCSGSGLALNSAGEPDICKTCGGNTVAPHGKPDGAVRQLEPWQFELDEVIGHLGAAIHQSVASDDQIIMAHVKAAHEIAKIVRRKA